MISIKYFAQNGEPKTIITMFDDETANLTIIGL